MVPPRGIYDNRPYAYPRRYDRYGYSAFGLGYFYYDQYAWYPSGGYGYGYYPGRPAVYGDGRYRYDVGSLRLDVMGPKDAQVLVDGYYAGIVDDFDGAFQSLDLESGSYRVEIAAPGFEPLVFDIRIQPGQKINYRGELRRVP